MYFRAKIVFTTIASSLIIACDGNQNANIYDIEIEHVVQSADKSIAFFLNDEDSIYYFNETQTGDIMSLDPVEFSKLESFLKEIADDSESLEIMIHIQSPSLLSHAERLEEKINEFGYGNTSLVMRDN